jgi:6-phosphogluconate dehydrogenase (decarboxylating)
MQLGMIGLGRMGASMVSRLLQGGHECIVFDMKPGQRPGPGQKKVRRGPLRWTISWPS